MPAFYTTWNIFTQAKTWEKVFHQVHIVTSIFSELVILLCRHCFNTCSTRFLSQYNGFPGGSAVKNLPANAGDTGSIPGTGRAPREENGNLLQYFCLRNPMSRRVWWATVHGVTKGSDTTWCLNNNNHTIQSSYYTSCLISINKHFP